MNTLTAAFLSAASLECRAITIRLFVGGEKKYISRYLVGREKRARGRGERQRERETERGREVRGKRKAKEPLPTKSVFLAGRI